MARLDARTRASLPDRAFAYIDSRGRRRLPIHDAAHVRNALARFNQVAFESDSTRERTRSRLLRAARKFGIVPVGFITRQLEVQRGHAKAGRLVIELGRNGAPAELESRLRKVLGDPGLQVLHWSEATGEWLDRQGQANSLPGPDDERTVTYLERDGRQATALVHEPGVLGDADLAKAIISAARFVAQKDRQLGSEVPATPSKAAPLPTGFLPLLMTDIEASSALVHQLGDRYSGLLNDVRRIIRDSVVEAGGREIDVRADDTFSIFERAPAALDAAIAFQRALAEHGWPDDLEVRVRVGIHSGCTTLTDVGYIGLAVHTAARVCSAAHGGQILVSGHTVNAASDSLPDGVGFMPLGRYRLAGLPNEEELYQVMSDGLIAEFGPLRG